MPSLSGPGAGAEPVGDLAIVLHSHMPYVEGFGTYPFGEEWLFDAVCRSYLPVMEVARDLTATVTPVLADQLEAPGVAERLRAFVSEYRVGSARADASDADGELRPACAAEASRYGAAQARLEGLGDDLLAIFTRPAARAGVELVSSAATHAVLPLLASTAGARLQVDAGLRSHRRRFGEPAGFWLPECAYEPGVERLLAERGFRYFCVDQSAHEGGLAALAPVATREGPVALTIDWEAIGWLWEMDGYPSDPGHADFHRKSLRGTRPWAISGEPYEPSAAASRARDQGREFLASMAERLGAFRAERGRPGLSVFAIDTELLGHWWWEGPEWLAAVLDGAAGAGIRLVTLSDGLASHPGEDRALAASTWGEGKDLRTWDSPSVADLAFAARRLELRLLRGVRSGATAGAAAERATRELLALQASDWAFLDSRGQAGDYPYARAVAHGEALLEAINSPALQDGRLRNLAPDLSLTPLFEP
ncbi:MAG: 1,4-alpha-glucan branching protein domain-containing protein [Solirubrobacterales bacterium]